MSWRRFVSSTCLKSIRLLAFLGAFSLIIAGECQMAFIFVFAAFGLLGLKIEKFPHLAKIFGAAQPAMAIFIFCVAVIDFFYLSRSFLLTVAHFLLSVQGVRLLSIRTLRESYGSLLLSSLMMLSASTLSVEWTFFLMLFIFLSGVIWTLMLLTLLDDSRAPENSEESLHEGSLLWKKLIPILRRSTGAAFLTTAACCAVVFIAFPRLNLRGFRGQFLQPVHKTGYSSSVNLSEGGRIQEDNSIVMRVAVSPEQKIMWTGYLRGRSLESFDGAVWEKFPMKTERVFRPWSRPVNLPSREKNSKNQLKQQIYLESMDSPLLFSQSRPTSVDIDRPFLDISHDGSLQRREGDSWRIRYEVESSLSPLDPVVGEEWGNRHPSRPLASAPIKEPERFPRKNRVFQQQAYDQALLFVPKDLQSRLIQTAEEWGAAAHTPVERAHALKERLRSEYRYSLDNRDLGEAGSSPLEAFLFTSKKGHCEYFAAALCLLLRSQGIPARLVTGFLSREWNDRGKYFVVRMKHAHAWVEAYVEPQGWVGLDPSPRDVFEGSAGPGLPKWNEFLDTLNLRWNQYILSYDFEKQVEIARSLGQGSEKISFRFGRLATLPHQMKDWAASLLHLNGTGESKASVSFPKEMGWLLLIIALVGLWSVSRRRGREPNRVWFYLPLVRRLEKRVGRKMDSQTLREFILQSEKQLGPSWPQALALQETYYRLRFGGGTTLSKAQATQIRSWLSSLSSSAVVVIWHL
ncbi:MAG: hypothetical protein KCHDKBKB_02092 [Elusimicrobia bacterium]|nr:hypothetical protein [Elusimicrobiota bacterium]